MKSKMMEKVKLSLLYSLAIGPIIIGGNLFLFFMDEIPWYDSNSAGLFDYVWLNIVILGTFILTTILTKWRGKRRGKIPAVDERTIQVMKNYLLLVLSAIFFISAIILLVLFFRGVETIEIGWIFVYLSGWILIFLLGGFIVRKV